MSTKKSESNNTRQRDQHAAEGAITRYYSRVGDQKRQKYRVLKETTKCVASLGCKRDMKNVIRTVRRSGQVPTVSKQMYDGDMSEIPDLMTALNSVRTAEEQFLKFPAKIRERFGHQINKFMEFVNNPKENMDEGIKLGIFQKVLPEKTPDPARVIVVNSDEKTAPAQ